MLGLAKYHESSACLHLLKTNMHIIPKSGLMPARFCHGGDTEQLHENNSRTLAADQLKEQIALRGCRDALLTKAAGAATKS